MPKLERNVDWVKELQTLVATADTPQERKAAFAFAEAIHPYLEKPDLLRTLLGKIMQSPPENVAVVASEARFSSIEELQQKVGPSVKVVALSSSARNVSPLSSKSDAMPNAWGRERDSRIAFPAPEAPEGDEEPSLAWSREFCGCARDATAGGAASGGLGPLRGLASCSGRLPRLPMRCSHFPISAAPSGCRRPAAHIRR